jgi:hypothetical protein
MWTHYLIGVFEHPGAEPLAAPISHLEKREELGYPEIQKSLPRFWTLSFGMRARF